MNLIKLSAWRLFLALGILESTLYIVSARWHLGKQPVSRQEFIFFILCMHANYAIALVLSGIKSLCSSRTVQPELGATALKGLSILLIALQIGVNLMIVSTLLSLGFWWGILLLALKLFVIAKKYIRS